MLPLLLLLVASTPALEPSFEADLGMSYWPVGLQVQAAPGVKHELWSQRDHVLLQDTFVRLDAWGALSPSYTRVGPRFVVSPVAVFEGSAHALWSPYFGTFSSLIGFDDPAAVYDEETLDKLVEAGMRGRGTSLIVGGDATLRGKVGPVIGAFSAGVDRWDIRAGEEVEGDYVYEPELDLLVARQDVVLEGNALLLYDWRFRDPTRWLFVGALATHGRAQVSGSQTTRIGPVGVLNVADGAWSLLLLAQAHVDHQVYERPYPPYLATRIRFVLPR